MTAPKPSRPHPALPVWALLRRDLLGMSTATASKDPVCPMSGLRYRALLVNDPDTMRTILCDQPQDFPKAGHLTDALRPLFGDSLYQSKGDAWEHQTGVVSPALRQDLPRALPHIFWAGQAALARLGAGDAPDAPVVLDRFTRHLSADVMVRVLFGRPILSDEADQILGALDDLQNAQPRLSFGATLPNVWGRWIPLPATTQVTARDLRKTLARWVARHRLAWVKGQNPTGLVTRLLEAKDPQTDRPLSKVALVEQVATVLVLGQATMASALAWCLHLLALYPDHQRAVAEEADHVLGRGPVDEGKLARLIQSRDVVRETLRLYPPIPVLMRETSADRTLHTHACPAGTHLLVSPWHHHRNANNWSEADAFKPNRWQAVDTCDPIRDGYMPFGAGPRACPSADFAMAHLTLLLSMVVRDWVVRPAGDTPTPRVGLTLQAHPGLTVKLARRRQSDGT